MPTATNEARSQTETPMTQPRLGNCDFLRKVKLFDIIREKNGTSFLEWVVLSIIKISTILNGTSWIVFDYTLLSSALV